MTDKIIDPKTIEQIWRDNLVRGETSNYVGPFTFQRFRKLMNRIPSNPRCKVCGVPFSGLGGALVKVALGRAPSGLNPRICNLCDQFAQQFQGGAEVEISMLFADVRGSTTLAERMAPLEFSRLIDRFYRVATDVLVDADAWLEKLIGDEVAGLFIPGFVGPQHAHTAVDAARAILQATGHGRPEGPWIPVGVGVHTGMAYVGAVGKPGGMTEITALGDAVNTAARLASHARQWEILVSEPSWAAAGLVAPGAEARRLQLKGRSEAVNVRVLGVV